MSQVVSRRENGKEDIKIHGKERCEKQSIKFPSGRTEKSQIGKNSRNHFGERITDSLKRLFINLDTVQLKSRNDTNDIHGYSFLILFLKIYLF